jgi:hypothetical protein
MVHGCKFGGFVLDVLFYGFWKVEIFGGDMKGKLHTFLLINRSADITYIGKAGTVLYCPGLLREECPIRDSVGSPP